MNLRAFMLVAGAAFVLFIGMTPKPAAADDLIVNPSDPSCSQTATPPCYPTITAAINAAHALYTANTASTFSIRVEAGTYNEAITLRAGVSSLLGRETARTILSGGGSATVVTASNISSSLANLTITNAAVGVSVSNNASLTITNNIFTVGTSGAAIQVQSSASTRITNNVFSQNGTAISSNSDILITNNIFFSNTTALANIGPLTFTQLTYNSFFANITDATNGQPGTNTVTTNPQFVDSAGNDFHLLAASPCIGAGNPNVAYNNPSFTPSVYPNTRNDMGAYGGPSTDTIPFPISGVTPATSSTGIYLRWKPNASYLASGYRVYYGTSPGVYTGTGAAEGASPINVTATSATLSGLPTAVAAPSTPTLSTPQVLNESLVLNWSAATGATGYIISYSTSSFNSSTMSSATRVNVGNTTSYTLPGLQNGQTYYVAVSAVAQKTYYLTVTAFDSAGTSTVGATPGIAHESAYSRPEVAVALGSPVESALSNIVSSFPEALSPYPALPNGQHQGCFIATAAYGHYSAPEVQALRDFRDRYLLTNTWGSAFVDWYYRHGPAAAAALNAHPEYKPVVRAALMPAVGVALFLTRTSLALRVGLMLIGCAGAYLLHRKRFSASGGSN